MSESDKFLKLFGGIFFSIGVLVLAIGIGMLAFFGLDVWFGAGVCLLIGIIFSAVGGGILLSLIKKANAQRKIEKEGKKYTGKIYGYVEDRSCTMNGAYLMNTRVRYFDDKGIEREAVLNTGFAVGSGDYPIGATIDIIALNTSYTWVKDSVRFEKIYGEEELMDDKPLDPELISMVAVSCPHCGASFSAAKGYVCKCAYCGGAIDN